MTEDYYTPIRYVKFQRVTHEEMNYIQTQYQKVESIRQLDTLPTSPSAGDVVFLTTDNRFYGYDGDEWGSIGDADLPFSDSEVLLRNSANVAKSVRFDLSLLTEGSTKVYYFPDGGGVIALASQVPVVTGTTERAVLYRGVSNYDIRENPAVLIAKTDIQPYIEIDKSAEHTGDVIKYNESTNNPKMRVETTGRTSVKRLCVFSGADG